MSKSAKILSMQSAIINFVRQNLPKDENKAKSGRIDGNRVIIGNRAYSYTTAVDMALYDGDRVVCLLPDTGNTAAIVGKA